MEIEREQDESLYVMVKKGEAESVEDLIECLCKIFLSEIAPLHPETEWDCVYFLLDPSVGRCLVFPARHKDYARDERGLCDSYDPDIEREYDEEGEGLVSDKDYSVLQDKYLHLYRDVISKVLKEMAPVFQEGALQYQFIEIADFHEEGDILLGTSFAEISS